MLEVSALISIGKPNKYLQHAHEFKLQLLQADDSLTLIGPLQISNASKCVAV